ncbi:MAG: 2-O-methyltransferase NoeI [Bacteroidetes bacterium ADurb.Bin408]|nr:MAG: 2-O-methyltransferase NoeI [Bacteroidetes bacterium ADurb.Bin408]
MIYFALKKMRNLLLNFFRWYFSEFPVRKGKIPVLNTISKLGLTKNVKKESLFDTDIKINLDLEDWIQKQIFFFGHYEVEKEETRFWKSLVKENDIILDIGANIGYYSLMASKRIKGGKIYAFEPVNQTYAKLIKNIELNNFQNIVPVNKAVSNKEDTIEIYVANNKNTGTSSITNHIHFCGEKQKAVAITIDSFVNENKLPKIDLIKIDVEGAESLVIEGMQESLAKFNPYILIELIDERLKAAGSSLIQIYDFLEKIGYKPFQINNDLKLAPAAKYKEGSLIIFKKS